jgi:isopentenyl-diphosphate delta-isomerase
MGKGLFENPNQKLICVDNVGRPTGRIVDRKTAHTPPGIKHLAIQVLVFNSKKELVLHKRPIVKIGGGALDSPTTHVLEGETPMSAASRCIRKEYGIIESSPIKILSGFSYEKDYGDGSCENEYCLVAFTVYDGPITPDKDQVPMVAKLSAKKVVAEPATSSKYPIWFYKSMELVKNDEEGAKLFE